MKIVLIRNTFIEGVGYVEGTRLDVSKEEANSLVRLKKARIVEEADEAKPKKPGAKKPVAKKPGAEPGGGKKE